METQYATIRVTDRTHSPHTPNLILAEDFDDLIEALRQELDTIADGAADSNDAKLVRRVGSRLKKLSALGEDEMDGYEFTIDDGARGIHFLVSDVR